jgi:hypothetical protein
MKEGAAILRRVFDMFSHLRYRMSSIPDPVRSVVGSSTRVASQAISLYILALHHRAPCKIILTLERANSKNAFTLTS